jgi:predicted phosphate transport protein (TIGR00153 family)
MFGSNKKKDGLFFEAFSNHAKKSVDAAKILVEMFARLAPKEGVSKGAYHTLPPPPDAKLDDKLVSLAAAIKDAEHAGDTITHHTMKRLHETWITPLDRFDIHGLINGLDDVLDLMEAVSVRVVLFEVRTAPPDAVDLAEVLVRACESMVHTMELLTDMKNASQILDICVEINRLENQADVIYRKALAELFRPGNDPLLAMKWREIFDALETAIDRCEDVANVVEGVVLEYA